MLMLMLRIILIASLVAQLARPPQYILRLDLCQGQVVVVKSGGACSPIVGDFQAGVPISAPAGPIAIAIGCGTSSTPCSPTPSSGGCGMKATPCDLPAPPGRCAVGLAAVDSVTAAEPAGCGCSMVEPDPKRPVAETSDPAPACPSQRCPTGRLPQNCCERVPAPPRKPADQQPVLNLKKIPTTPPPFVAALKAPSLPPPVATGRCIDGRPPREGSELRPTLCIWRN